MHAPGVDEVSEIIDRVKHWSPPSRIILARRILESLDPSASGETTRESSVANPLRGVPVELVVGLLKTDSEPPDDEECRRIVEEERWRKYGP